MIFLARMPKISIQLGILSLWAVFIGWTLWQHAQNSQLPPLYDAISYYQKAYNFWNQVHQHKLFNPFNLEPSFRPPGTILMSYPFGFDIDYRGFYFRSTFLPIALSSLAVIIAGYRRDLDSKSKWYLVLVAAFISTLPCFYDFELTPELQSPSYWGLVDNFLAGVAALATGAMVRSVLTRSLVWLALATILSSFCLLIKPAGALIMMLTGLAWFGLAALNLQSQWHSSAGRKSTLRYLLHGIIIFAIPYFAVLTCALTSDYLSDQNMAAGNGAIGIMQTEWQLPWLAFMGLIQVGPGYPFMAWLFLMIIIFIYYLWRIPGSYNPNSKRLFIGLLIASGLTFIFGIWFWIFGSGGGTFIRYFIPFPLMAAILVSPAILVTMRRMPDWQIKILSIVMMMPIINIGMLLPQTHASIEWQKWTGVNLNSDTSDPVLNQAQNFATLVKREGHNANVYSISLNATDAKFQSVVDYARFAMSPMPSVSTFRPIDWQRPSTYRKEEMLNADYWLFTPVRDPNISRTALAASAIEDLAQETLLFQAWATQLTTKEGMTLVSDTPLARVLRVNDPTLLELAFDTMVEKHQWRSIFNNANPKNRYSEKELADALVLNPPSLEKVNFGDRFHLRALSVSRLGNDITVRFWWKPLSPLAENDWVLFLQSIDDEGKIIINNSALTRFNQSLASLDGTFLFGQISFKNPAWNGAHRLAVGFYRPNQTLPTADKGVRDWDNQRVIVPLP